MNGMTLLRFRNRALGMVAPTRVANQAAELFLTPRRYPLKDWEKEAELRCTRKTFANELSAACWGSGAKKILLMHGWESRATQMAALVQPLVELGYQVIAIDAPLHGQSRGEKANPISFTDAIIAADHAFGPFYGAIGHSMGAAALALALASGVQAERCVLLSSPAVVLDTLLSFAGYIGLSANCTRQFIHAVEQDVGQPAKTLDVARALSLSACKTLLIHSRDDLEVPYDALIRLQRANQAAEVYSPDALGHRRVLRDNLVIDRISEFLKQ